MKQTPSLIRDYLAAFKLANPGSDEPRIAYQAGWFKLGWSIDAPGAGTRYRQADFVQMTANLAARAAERELRKLEQQEDDFAYLESGMVE